MSCFSSNFLFLDFASFTFPGETTNCVNQEGSDAFYLALLCISHITVSHVISPFRILCFFFFLLLFFVEQLKVNPSQSRNRGKRASLHFNQGCCCLPPDSTLLADPVCEGYVTRPIISSDLNLSLSLSGKPWQGELHCCFNIQAANQVLAFISLNIYLSLGL